MTSFSPPYIHIKPLDCANPLAFKVFPHRQTAPVSLYYPSGYVHSPVERRMPDLQTHYPCVGLA
jgi:hypothetical protein